MLRNLTCAALFAVWSLGLAHSVATASDSKPMAEQLRFFEEKVRPLLAENCFKCHGAEKQKGSLRLDSLATILAGGESGPAVVPGKPEESLLVEAINYESFEMPPSGKLNDNAIAVLSNWIKMGAPWPAGDPPIAVAASKVRTITDEDRRWWAYQPLRDVAVPKVDGTATCRNEVDRFIVARLQQQQLSPAPEADRLTLIRRAYFDLIGLPPTPEEIDAFLSDPSADAYDKLIDRLLDDARYGERWARHWLDLVRYAESDGFKQDAFRPNAWRYRDYVVRSLNDDKPYDRFVMEQLAGDEIAPHDPDALAATGYLRHWIYEYNQRDVRTQWSNILNDVTDVTADVFLGMGMGCARCHDHKFDPILQRDYFRLQAFFTPLRPRDDLPTGTAEELADYHRKLTAWEAKTADLRRQIDEIERPIFQQTANPAINKFPPDIRPMLRKAPGDRSPFEQQIAELAFRQVQEEYDKLNIASKLKGEEKDKWSTLTAELVEYETQKPKPLPTAYCVTDIGRDAPPTMIPGDRKQEAIEPGFLTVLDPSTAAIESLPEAPNSTGRRTALARWIASPDNPLSTRVIVNRIWQYHFGRGLVATASDFGHLGEPPTHPELLDWLTRQFIDHGWSMKHMHRLMMTSATYRQASLPPQAPSPKLQFLDPDNRLLARMNVHRLDAEQIRDAVLAVTGELNPAAGGPSVDAGQPRRTIYTKVVRNTRDPLLDVFDAPDGFSSISQRNVTTTPTQSLLMINGSWPLQRAKALAGRLQKEKLDGEPLVRRAYRLAYGREPTPSQLAAALSFLNEQSQPATPQGSSDLAGRFVEPSLLVAKERTGEVRNNGGAGGLVASPTIDAPGRAALIQPNGPQRPLTVPDNESLPAGDFTIEACFVLRSLYPDATVRTIVSQWDSDNNHPGWALGVTSEKSAHKPRNLILQLVGDPAKGGAGYEVVASNLRPELNKPYYAAVSVKIAETGESGVTFYLKELSSPDAPLQTANVAHKVTAHYRSNSALTIGGRDNSPRHIWDGLIDDVRLSTAALARDELLIHNVANTDKIVGFWRFDETPGFEKDASGKGNDIKPTTQTANSDATALVDFCHVLLNSNEFLYVD
jgi:hypothetical protein